MILENIRFDVASTLSSARTAMLVAYGNDMIALGVKQDLQEKLRGYSDAPLSLINYWAVFALCVIIKHKVTISGDSDFATYDALYNLSELAITLQKLNIDITVYYTIFSLFGY